MLKIATIRVGLGLIVLALVATLQPATAEVREGSFELELYGGYYNPGPDALDGEATLGGRFGYNFTQRFFLQATLGYAQFEQSVVQGVNSGTVELDLWNLDFSFGYNFVVDRNVTPEVHAGFGGGFGTAGGSLEINDPDICGTLACTVLFSNLSDDSFTLHGGAGVRIDLSRLIYLRPVILTRWFAARDDDQWDTELSVSVGFKFGGS